VAASLRRDLGIDVQTVEGQYGEFTVLVDGEEIVTGGPLAFLGVLPSIESVRDRVKAKIGASHGKQS
jgi:hypothetical protein